MCLLHGMAHIYCINKDINSINKHDTLNVRWAEKKYLISSSLLFKYLKLYSHELLLMELKGSMTSLLMFDKVVAENIHFWLEIPDLVATNMSGNVHRSP